MTFYEAGLAILEKAGHPLTYQEIAAQAVKEGILSHVGQMPELTMRERLVALAKRHADRRVLVVGPGQFALTDWGLPEDEGALLELEKMPEAEPEGPPRRGRERHPTVTKASGSRESQARKRKRRLAPLSSVAQDLLRDAAAPLSVSDLLERARDKGLVSEDLSREMFVGALQEENRRRTKSGKRAIFELGEGDTVTYLPPAEPQEPTQGPRAEVGGVSQRPSPAAAVQSLESRRNAARAIRRLLNDLGAGALEQAVTALLEKSGYRELRSYTPRGFESGERVRMLTARRRLGLTEVRFVVRLAPAGEGDVQKDDVRKLRAELLSANAHAGVVIGPADASREARNESQLVGQPLVTLLCADSLAEEMVFRQVGCDTYEMVAVNEGFWRDLRRTARSSEATAARSRSVAATPRRPEAPESEEAEEPSEAAGITEPDASDEEESTSAPEIEQFLNEPIAPKPPDAVPLESEDGNPVEHAERRDDNQGS
jgi:hypothetical protein